jgi:hypothetical protein
VRRGIWLVADPYLRFWFRFVLPYRNRLEHGVDVDRIYSDVVAPALDHFISKPTFEEVCRAWVLDQMEAGTLPMSDRVGAWWGPVPAPAPGQPRRQAEAELEVVAATGTRVVLAGEAEWTPDPVGFGALSHLRDVMQYVPGTDEETELVLFGRAFEPRLQTHAAAERVRLVTAEDLYA